MSTQQNNDESLTTIVSNEIINTSIDTGIDYSELVLDTFLQDGVLKEIPFVKTIYAIGKIGSSVKERFFVKKLFVFLKEFHNGTVDSQTLTEFKMRFNTEEKYRNNVTEQVMIYLDSFLTIEKSKILAKLLRGHFEGHFDWEHFNHLSTCLNDINPKAFNFLQLLSNHNFKIEEDKNHRGIPRDGESEALLYSCGIAFETSSWSSGFNISQLGKDLYNYGIK